jgi:hypothetical protein
MTRADLNALTSDDVFVLPSGRPSNWSLTTLYGLTASEFFCGIADFVMEENGFPWRTITQFSKLSSLTPRP